VIYASAQKNLGATGLTIVIVRRDLLGRADERTPTTFDYAVHDRNGSRYTTPPVFAWYLAGLMLRWIRLRGGVPEMAAAARRKADVVYAALDGSGFYSNRVEPASRSRTSIPFFLPEADLEELFLAEAEKFGLKALRGHSSLGGLRASLYLGMPETGAHALAEFLGDFEARHG
jgi:phosphoserine aminotransferase